MTKLIIEDNEYDTEDLTEEQTAIVNTLNLGQNSIGLLNHILQCTKAIHQMKFGELKTSLDDEPDDK